MMYLCRCIERGAREELVGFENGFVAVQRAIHEARIDTAAAQDATAATLQALAATR